MRYTKHNLLIVIILLALASCGKKSTPNPTPAVAASVYVTGTCKSSANGLPMAVYWKNGVRVGLTDSTGTNISVATGIAISGTDVYISGAVNFVATYWKNGNAVSLSTDGSYANAIAVSGTDVYVAGFSYDAVKGNVPTYWKNGVPVELPGGGVEATFADGITVVGNDVYVAGNIQGASSQDVVYWKNGVLTTIATSPSSYATYYANVYIDGWVNIGVSGSDVYITGAAPGHLTAEYWKNGIATYLVNDPTATSVLNNITINGTDVYTAGFYKGPAYWKNGVLNTLPGNTQTSSYVANAIAINGNDIYIAGSGTNAVYWKNGTLIPLSGNDLVTTGIAVGQN